MAFRHDLVREAVDATLPRTVRQSLRRRAVDVMLRHGAPPSDVAELVMDVAKPGDSEAIAILRRAAAETGRVSPTVASLLSRRALDLTPPGDPGRGPLTAETLAYLIYAGKAAEGGQADDRRRGRPHRSGGRGRGQAQPRRTCRCSTRRPTSSSSASARSTCPTCPTELRIHLLSFLSLGLDLFGDASAAEKTARDAAAAAQGERRSRQTRCSRWSRGPRRRSARGLAAGPRPRRRSAVARRHSVQGRPSGCGCRTRGRR